MYIYTHYISKEYIDCILCNTAPHSHFTLHPGHFTDFFINIYSNNDIMLINTGALCRCKFFAKVRYCRIYKIYTSIFSVYIVYEIYNSIKSHQHSQIYKIYTSKFSVYIVYKYTRSKVTSVILNKQNIHQYIVSVYCV